MTPYMEMTECSNEDCDKRTRVTSEHKSRVAPEHLGLCAKCYRKTLAYKQDRADKQQERRKFLNDYKLYRGCADCGYRDRPYVLEFDHVVQEKGRDIGGWAAGLMNTSKGVKPSPALIEELSKCEVVCANCHRIRTHERGQQSGRKDKYQGLDGS